MRSGGFVPVGVHENPRLNLCGRKPPHWSS